MKGKGLGGPLNQYKGQQCDKRREAQSKPTGGSVSPRNDDPLPQVDNSQGPHGGAGQSPAGTRGRKPRADRAQAPGKRGVPLTYTRPHPCAHCGEPLQAQHPPQKD